MEKKKLLLVSKRLQSDPRGGREMLSKLNSDILKKLFKEEFIQLEIDKKNKQNLSFIKSIFQCHIDGLNKYIIREINAAVKRERTDLIFIDGSNYGALAKELRKRNSNVKIITFFHNVEARFFWGSFKERTSIKALLILLVNYFAEKMAINNSDEIITLCDRDSKLLKKIYGKKASCICPMSLEDKWEESYKRFESVSPEDSALFVGGLFYANKSGIEWFISKVMPKVSVHLYIVGKGFELHKRKLEASGKVTVIGEVDKVIDWYMKVKFVIAPIFDGSGMKTKIAEALMFGKKVIGTPEAFTGYEDICFQAGWICNNDVEFINAINMANVSIHKKFDPKMRQLYLKYYSPTAAKRNFEDLLQ